MNIKKRKKDLLIVLLLIILTILADLVISANTIKRYTEITIEKDDLLGDNEKNLKDFLLQDDGSLVSQTNDPWVEYSLEYPMYIKSVDIMVDWVNPERRYAQVYLILEDGNWIYQSFYLHSGINTIQFEDENTKVKNMRFDLLSQNNCYVKVNQIIINSKNTLTKKYHLCLLVGVILILFLNLFIQKIRNKKCSEFKELLIGTIVSGAISFLLCVFAPLDIYFNNKTEFWFDLYTLLPIILIMFIEGALIGIIVLFMLFLIDKKIYQMGVCCGLAILIGCYIQGNFLVNHLPPLDGSSFKWTDYSLERLKSFILWFCVVLVIILLLKFVHFEKMLIVTKYISTFLTGMLMLTICIEGFMSNGFERKLDAVITIKNQLEMSNKENFVILVLDALDAKTFSEVMSEHLEYEEYFSDFTYYPNTLGAYPFTSRSVPFILSGEWFENKTSFEKYNKNVYANSNLFAELESRNYKLGMYETAIPLWDDSIYRFDNVFECKKEISSYMDFIKSQLMLIGFKYAPFDMKKFCLLYPSEFDLLKQYNENLMYQEFSDNNLRFYNALQTEQITHTDQDSFKFIHIEGAHVPYQYDENVNLIQEGTYEQNIEASITIANTYLEKLKTSNVYDNSVIIIMSDHGFINNRQNPLLMIKGRDEKHNMQISNAPISYDDLSDAYISLLNGELGDNVFEWKEGDERERRFLFYQFLDENHMVEYLQTGDACNTSTMNPTGAEFNQ